MSRWICLALAALLAGCAVPVSQSGGMTSRVMPRIEIRDSSATVYVTIEVWGDHEGNSGASVASATQTVRPDITVPVLP